MRWEYHVWERALPSEDDFNRLGAKGWELVSVFVISTITGDRLQAVFKRPKAES